MTQIFRVPFDEAVSTLARILRTLGFAADRAELCARLFVESSCDGVYSHGIHRFPRFVRTARKGIMHPDASPALIEARGALERWDGRHGPGNLNAWQSMARAIELARAHGIGCVALAHTNHWLRGGTYGWQAADAGAMAVCWTNTLANVPPWGASVAAVGNNPLVLAVPRAEGHVVLDIAMSQFSYGALEGYRRRGEELPVDGGYDRSGRLTRNAAEIEATHRPLPIGLWKGSGLALLLDLIAGTLSGGQFTHEFDRNPELESGLSQVFIAFDIGGRERLVDAVIENLRAMAPGARYPGERVLAARRENRQLGVPVDAEIWREVTRHVD